MKFVIFSEAYIASSFAMGVASLGHTYDVCHGGTWDDNYFIPGDVAVVVGFRDAQQRIIDCYDRKNIPFIVIDLGFVHRWSRDEIGNDDSYLQVGYHKGLNWLPDSAPKDRMKKLGLKYPGKVDTKSKTILVAGQWFQDANNPFNTNKEVISWMDDASRVIQEAGFTPKIRKHPKIARDDKETLEFLEEALSDVCGVVCYSSNIGNDALRAGIPVFCSPTAMYSDLGNAFWPANLKKPYFPDKDTWENYFARLAYAQWSIAELKSGEPIKYFLKMREKEGGLPVSAVTPVEIAEEVEAQSDQVGDSPELPLTDDKVVSIQSNINKASEVLTPDALEDVDDQGDDEDLTDELLEDDLFDQKVVPPKTKKRTALKKARSRSR